MKTPTIFPPSQYTSMRWKNGLGKTTELLKKTAPGTEDFIWRLSMADVAANGEFSNFSGFDRTLILLSGSGIELDCSETGLLTLEHRLQAARFSGDETTSATLRAGPITDFNIITARNHCRAIVAGHNTMGPTTITVDCSVLLVYALDGTLAISNPQSQDLVVPADHLLQLEDPNPTQRTFSGAPFICVQIVNI